MEIKKNYSHLEERNSYYHTIINTMDSLIRAEGNQRFDSEITIPEWVGINPPMLSVSSYKTASSIGIFSYIDFNTADNISKVYMVQDELQKLGSEAIRSLISGEIYNSQSIHFLFTIFTELNTGWINAADRALATNPIK